MKSIANQYRDLKEGKMSQANFMRNLRMSMPQVTNVMSFGDAVKVLKNKGIITESYDNQVGQSFDLDVKSERGDGSVQNYQLKNVKLVNANGRIFEKPDGTTVTLAPSDKYTSTKVDTTTENNEYSIPEVADKEKDNRYNSLVSTNRGEDKEWAKLSRDEKEKMMYADTDSDLANLDPNEVGGLGRHQNLSKGIDDNSDAEFDAILKQLEDEMDGEVAVKSDVLDEPLEEVELTPQQIVAKYNEMFGKNPQTTFVDVAKALNVDEKAVAGALGLGINVFEELNEAKEKTNPNKVHPQEYTMGIRYELKVAKGDVVKAERAVLKNLAKEPFYYTVLKLSGKDTHKEAPAVKEESPKKKSKKKEVELVDTINAMQKVKMPKAEEKKKLKENQLNEGGEYTFIGRLNSAELKKIHEIIPDIEIDVEQDDDMERTTVTSKFYNNKFIEQAIDGVINPSKETMRPGVDIGKSFEKFKSKLAEMVKKAMAEMYDGRDNLTNISDDTK